MPRILKPEETSVLAKMRLNAGMRAEDLGRELDVSHSTVCRFERGKRISRLIASRYLRYFDIDIARKETWPEGLEIIDLGGAVRIQFGEDGTSATQ